MEVKTMSRHESLMACLRLRFRHGQSFDGDFLRDHNVSASECADIESALATAIGLYLDTRREMRQEGLPSVVANRRLATSLLRETMEEEEKGAS